MSGRFEARGQVAIVGYGQSTLYRHAPVPLGSLAIDACQKAIADAGLKPEQIDGLATYPLFPASTPHTNEDGQDFVSTSFVAKHLGIHLRWRCDYEWGGQIAGAFIQGVNAVAAGAADYVMVHRALHNPPGRYHGFDSTIAEGSRQWTAPYGHAGPAGIAFAYREYMERYGATAEDMATLVTTIRKNAQTNPLSYWYGSTTLTQEDYLNSRMIADPMHILDCDMPIDGAGAFILTSAERARDLPHKPVYIAGFVLNQSTLPNGPDGLLPVRPSTLDEMMEAGMEAGKRLWEHAGLSPKDIDCPQLYDGFSPLTYFWLESLGFCKVGEAHSFIQDGRIDPSGDFPLLSGGGNIGNARIHGIAHIRENYLQLSQRAGDRQLKKATIGLSSHSVLGAGGALVFSADQI